MEKYFNLRSVGLMSMVLALALMTGCSITDPSDDFEISIQMPETGTVISGQIFDNNGEQIDDQSVRVSILGRDADAVVDLLNEQLSSLTTESGFIVMALNDTITPTRAEPIKVTLKIVTANYMTAYKNLVIYSANDQNFGVSLVSTDVNDLPPGLAGAEDNSGECDNTGAVTTPVNLGTPPNPISGAVTSINLNSGTRVLDGNGNPLAGGLTTSMLVMDMSNPSYGNAGQYFPGGFDDVQTDEPGRNILPKVFSTFSVTDEAGKVAASFDPPAAMSMQISGDTYNAATLRPLADGDVMSFFALDDDGVWVHQVDRPISGPDENGNFTVVYEVAESAALPEVKNGEVLISGANEDPGAGLLLADNLGDNTIGMNVRVTVENAEGYMLTVVLGCTDLFHSLTVDSESGVFDFFATVPRNPLSIEWIPQIVTADVFDGDGIKVAEMSEVYFEDVEADPWQLNITSTGFTPPDNQKSVDIHMFALMPEGRDPSVIRPSGIAAQIQEVGQDSWTSVGVIQQGMLTVNGLNIGSSYVFRGTYTFNDETRSANTPWERLITAETDSLNYRYQLSEDEADDYENN